MDIKGGEISFIVFGLRINHSNLLAIAFESGRALIATVSSFKL